MRSFVLLTGLISLVLAMPSLAIDRSSLFTQGALFNVQLEENSVPEPDVTIMETDRGTVEEYRINGQLYQIRVIPKNGKPYYLIDTDGDGVMETRSNELSPNLLIPSWTLLRWK